MKHSKLANGSAHELPIGRSPSRAEQDQMAAAQSPNALDACCLFGERKTITERGSDRMLPEIHSESGHSRPALRTFSRI